MSLPDYGALGPALLVAEKSVPQLDAGIADKLAQAVREGCTVPTGTSHVNGERWRLIADAANLSKKDTRELALWLEEVYSEAMAERFAQAPRDITSASRVQTGLPAAPSASSYDPETAFKGETSSGPGLSGITTAADFDRLIASMSPAGRPPSGHVSAPVPVTLTVDSDAQDGATGDQLATLTFVFQTGVMPPADSGIRYGSDPSLSKSFTKVKGGHSTVLPDLLRGDGASTMDLHNHFGAGVNLLRANGYEKMSRRLSDMWAELQRHLPAFELQKAYLIGYMRKYPGRGIPILLDRDLVLLAIATSTQSGPSEQMTKLTTDLTEIRKELASMKEKVAEVAAMKNELAQLKTKVAAGRTAKTCTWCGGMGHDEATCRKKEQGVPKST